jgi:branched-chain amino acid transport system substrate-binding protein
MQEGPPGRCEEPYNEVLTLERSLGKASVAREGSAATFKKHLVRLVVGTVLVSACESVPPTSTAPAPAGPGEPSGTHSFVKVAFIQDLSPEPALGRTLPAFHAVEMAFTIASADAKATASVEVVTFDVEGNLDTARDIAAEITEDPSYVAAIAAPDLTGQQEIADLLAGVPILSLSSRGSVHRKSGAWLRFVAPLRDQAVELARLAKSLRASRRGVCLAPAQTPADRVARYARRALGREIRIDSVSSTAQIASAGCGTVVWTGSGVDAAAVAFDLDRDVRLIGASGLRDPDFLEEAGRAAEGAMAICSCADVSTSLDLEARRFIQTYQAEFGTAPGAFALEGWDAARLILAGLDTVGPTRERLGSWIADVTRFEGLDSTYRWAAGELIEPRAFTRTYRIVGGRWVLGRETR